MSAPASSPQGPGPRRTAFGTIVGMPPVVREPVRLGQLSSTTLRSVYAHDETPCSDAFHPDRWSNPPPIGVAPIVPCDEPEEDDPVQVFPRPASTSPVGQPIQVAEPSEPEPPEPLTERWHGRQASDVPAAEPPTERWHASAASEPVPEDPIILPFRDREAAGANRLLVLAAVTSALLLLALVFGVLVWA